MSSLRGAATARVAPAPVRVVDSHVSRSTLFRSVVFGYQSWFDSAVLQNAIAVQPRNTLIIDPEPQQFSGKVLTLHPASETPVAVQASGQGGGAGSSGVYILSPGQSVEPLGRDPFISFTWGLPFGWLGGGMATLIVGQEKYQPEGFTSKAEVIFQRTRIAVVQPAAIPAAAPLNWPSRFPWTNASANTSVGVVGQQGQPHIAPIPTRTILTLRTLGALVAVASMRCIVQGSNEFALDKGGVAGSLDLTNPIYEDVNWPAFASLTSGGGNLSTQNPSIILDASHPLTRCGADGGGVVFVDGSGAAALLTGAYVDVVRFGTL